MDAAEHERLTEREAILVAILAAAERLSELLAVVQSVPDDDALTQRVAALLGCDEPAARTVLAMPLGTGSPTRQRRLRRELDEVRQTLGQFS